MLATLDFDELAARDELELIDDELLTAATEEADETLLDVFVKEGVNFGVELALEFAVNDGRGEAAAAL